ncbi:hypothetical protein [Micromonospora echinofusca]|uniref:4-amino-4-deoxy-L-arabinose transferase n=1 Tax=Micromonospora echinofusca TaxID=47858 RepID=A0ABS3VYE6_MICEH|nr:hypothetical protein [Micromonospora echinofusca]MBO4209528.1 hypothetical protein [Micromonospora echinofusca]
MSATTQRGAGRVRRRLDRPALVALLLGSAGLGYRLVLTLLTVPSSNSDEAAFGLAALHIAAGRERPVFLYGQHYMGMLEAYLAAPLLAVTGPSWPVLRLPLLALYALFVYLMYRLTRRVFSPWFATVVVGLLALGSERVVRDQLTAVGGRPEVKPVVVALLLIALALGQRTVRHRWPAYATFGLLTGVAVWSDWLILPYLAVAGAVLLVAAGRELFGVPAVLLVAGFVVGVAPMLVDNLTAPPGEDSLSVFREVSAGTGGSAPLVDRLRGGLTVSLPLASGFCPTAGCPRGLALVPPVYLGLLATTAVLALVGWRRAGDTAVRVGPAVQLALVAGAVLTLTGYLRSPLAATGPLENARYLSVLQLSLPAVLWPAWRAARGLVRRTAGPARWLVGVPGVALLAAVTALAAWTTGVLVAESGAIRAEERAARDLAATLRRDGPRHVYTDYWTCHRMIFHTGEDVLCAVLGDRLRPGQNRYPPYQAAVDAADRVGYVFEVGSAPDRALRRYLDRRAVDAAVTEIGGYRVYRPAVPVRPWQ